MRKEDVKEIYSIGVDDGTLVLVKRNLEHWLKCREKYYSAPDMLINPKFSIRKGGVLEIDSIRMSYTTIKKEVKDSVFFDWLPTPVSELNPNWRDIIFFTEEDLIKKDVVTWSGRFPFKKRNNEKDVLHLNPGNYLDISSKYNYTEATSNYRIIGFRKESVHGLICQ